MAEAEIDVDFRDVRSASMSEDEWQVLLGDSGDNLVDRKSQAYRNLNAWMRETRQTLNWPTALPSWPAP